MFCLKGDSFNIIAKFNPVKIKCLLPSLFINKNVKITDHRWIEQTEE